MSERRLEYCCRCDDPTGRAGRGDDSLYTDDGRGPFCSECYHALTDEPREKAATIPMDWEAAG